MSPLQKVANNIKDRFPSAIVRGTQKSEGGEFVDLFLDQLCIGVTFREGYFDVAAVASGPITVFKKSKLTITQVLPTLEKFLNDRFRVER